MSKVVGAPAGSLVKVYECTCVKCYKVERLFPSLVNSRAALWRRGWHRTRHGAWFCPKCRPEPYATLIKKVPSSSQYKPRV